MSSATNFIYYDYHIHTNLSLDSKALLEHIIEQAINLNLKEIAITDHVEPNELTGEIEDSTLYEHFDKINSFQDKYKDKIKILKGAEVTLYTDNEVQFNNFVERHKDIDFIIGSSHALDKKNLYYGYNYEEHNKKDIYEAYLNEILININKHNFSVYGHLDFISRYVHYDNPFLNYNEFKELLDEIFKALVRNNKGLEVNTSGLRYGIDCFYPSKELLKRYKELGGEIVTVGSDSHKASDVGRDFHRAYDYLKSCGFDYITTYEKLKPKMIKI